MAVGVGANVSGAGPFPDVGGHDGAGVAELGGPLTGFGDVLILVEDFVFGDENLYVCVRSA